MLIAATPSYQLSATLMRKAHIATWRRACLARAAVTAVLCCWAIIISGISAAAQQTYVVASSKIRWTIDLAQISCISLRENGANIFGSVYFNDLRIPEILKDIFPHVAIERQNEQCRNVLVFAILYNNTKAITYQYKPATILMSFDLCELDGFGKIDTKKCGSKNLYLFIPKLDPLEALEIGAKAFVHEQVNKWEIVNVSVKSSQR